MCGVENLHWLPEEPNWSDFRDGPTGLTEEHRGTRRDIDGDPHPLCHLSTALGRLQVFDEQRWLTGRGYDGRIVYVES